MCTSFVFAFNLIFDKRLSELCLLSLPSRHHLVRLPYVFRLRRPNWSLFALTYPFPDVCMTHMKYKIALLSVVSML